MTNFFLIYRPFHFEYSKEIIATHFVSDTNIIINHFPSSFKREQGEFIKEINNLPPGAFKMSIAVKKVKRQFVALAKTNEPMQIFIPHTLAILSNYSFFTLSKKYSNVRINIFYEGVIVFYKYEHHYWQNIGYYASRWLIAFLTGIRYKPEKHLLNLHSDTIHKIYTPFLNIDAPKEKLVETSLHKKDYVTVKNSCVILGLIIEDRHKAEMIRIIESIYTKIDELNITKIYFKEHPSFKNDMFEIIAKERGKKLSIINNTEPIENIIENYRPEYIMSIWSSGLINLSKMLPVSSRIYCFVTEKITEKDEVKKIINAFREQNIDIFYV